MSFLKVCLHDYRISVTHSEQHAIEISSLILVETVCSTYFDESLFFIFHVRLLLFMTLTVL